MGRLPLIAAVGLAFGTSAQAVRVGGIDDPPLAPHSMRIALRRITTDVARLGLDEEVDRLRSVLQRLGDDARDLEKLDQRWQKELRKDGSARRSREAVAAELRGEAERLAGQLARAEPERRMRLAELILELDSQEPRANEILGLELHDGSWARPENVARLEAKGRISDLIVRSRKLEFPTESAPSRLPALEGVYEGVTIHEVSARGVGVHGNFDRAKLERIVVEALRGTALSSALRGGELAIPDRLFGRHFLLLDTEQSYEVALYEALENQGISREEYDKQVNGNYSTFTDHRGWVTTRWRTEADFKALVLWTLVRQLLGPATQPCLEAGHVNWLTLRLFGTSMPTYSSAELIDPNLRTESDADESRMREALFRASGTSLYGCRSWMIQRAALGRDTPWSRAMTEHLSQIDGEALFKTTLVNELLQESGMLAHLLEETRAATDRVAAFERALGRPLPEFEEEWARWLVHDDAGSPPGIVQRLGEEAAVDDTGLERAMADAVNRVRARALSDQHAEFEEVRPFPDLSDGARAHARYLARHRDQQTRWPDAHEEYSDEEGFSPEGSWAGLHSVIHYASDPDEALSGWMGSFYHRLPLLHPGLFGVGVAQEGGVLVMDVGSLVLDPWREHWVAWPPDAAQRIPVGFAPEIPSPVPGEDQADWGYPVTLQVFLPEQDAEMRVTMRLFEGVPDGESVVDCHFITPEEPKFPELAPPNAWCLIPKERLRPGTIYTVVAERQGAGEERIWRFRTGS